MFELVSGGPRHPFHDRTVAPALVSAIGHVVIAAVIVLVPLMYATQSLPSVATMRAFVAMEPIASPPPPPPPPPPSEPARTAAANRPTPPSTSAERLAAPLEAPVEVRPEAPVIGEAAGVVGGVEGGVIGGVVGGIVGGLVAAAPPPPPPPPPPAAVPAAPEPVRIGGNLRAPMLLHRVEPTYPAIAVTAKVVGMVILEATVGTDGSVESVRVLRGIKFLDESAVEAVKQWRYSPLVLNGVPTPFVLSVVLNFSIKDS